MLERVRREETDRLERFREKRPLNRDRGCAAGIAEAVVSGILGVWTRSRRRRRSEDTREDVTY